MPEHNWMTLKDGDRQCVNCGRYDSIEGEQACDDPIPTTAEKLLEQLIRADWMFTDAHDADETYNRTDLELVADRAWSKAKANAIAFLGIEPPPNPWSSEPTDISPENIARMNANFHEQLRSYGQDQCPTCGAWHDKAFLQTVTSR